MTQKEALKFFDIIKNDDLSSFCMLIENDKQLLNVSFGRFPILSVCYLYNSKKIAKKFLKELKSINEFDVVYEPFLIYKDFKAKVKSSIKVYANKNNFVMPIEMKAILGHDLFVKRNFNRFAKSKTTDENLINLYQTNNQKCDIIGKKIKISAKKMSKKRKKLIIFTNLGAFSIVSIVATILLVISNTIGLGTSFNPRKVYVQNDLFSAINRGMCVSIQNDIELTKDANIKNYGGTIFGNDKVLTINYEYGNYIFETFSGNVSDLTIKNFDINKITETDISLFAKINIGKIENLKIEATASVKFQSTNEESFFSPIAVENYGYIKNCTTTCDLNIISKSSLDTYVSGFVGKNYGNVSMCQALENSKIETENVDVAGVVAINNYGGEISNCKNFANMSQTCTIGTWSPNVAGVVMNNFGKISNCFNHGNIEVKKTVETSNNAALFAGGICANNTNLIEHSKNDGNIKTESHNSMIYAGGICAYMTSKTQNDDPKISYCGTVGSFDISKNDDDVFACVGSFAGYLTGELSNCFSMSTFLQEYSQEKKFMISTVVGSSYGYPTFFDTQIMISLEKVYTLASEKTEKPISVVFLQSGYIFIDTLNSGDMITICNSENQIKTSDVYWEE